MPGAATIAPAAHGTLAVVAYESYKLPEPGTSYKPDLGLVRIMRPVGGIRSTSDLAEKPESAGGMIAGSHFTAGKITP